MNVKDLLSERTNYMKASDIRELLKWATADVISFGGGLPDLSQLPLNEYSEVAKFVVSNYGLKALQYGKTEGVDELKEELAKFMAKQGIRTDASLILPTVGSQEALELMARVFIDPGDVIVTEKPTYLAALQAFRVYRARVIGVDMDNNGLIIDKLEDTIKRLRSEGARIKFIYTIPICQNPTGVMMSLDRRKALLELASKYDLMILEDNPYSYFTFDPVDTTPLKALDNEDRVIYTSTFSKIIAPGIRLGWVVANQEVVNWLSIAKQAMNLHTPTLSQYIAYELLRRGIVDRYISKIKETYKVKRDAMLDALSKYMPSGVSWTRPSGGMFIWVTVPGDVRTEDMLNLAIRKYKVAYVPGKSFYPDEDVHNDMRLNFTYPSIDQIYDGVRRLSLAIEEYRGR
ncbi:PLP-dependent aminotransferase family protein [Caldivirga sp. UBA161]|uniref:aminotransferase-like domain-containing protein n=1 Tax=Caldivirga sp. UBA161 TaxID=1915569 RepID=UPI0025BEB8A4|nr:PLP-dependent aminotransferase family protein [Caldivirga sp. UBA161]